MQLEGSIKEGGYRLIPTAPARMIIAFSQIDGRRLEAAEVSLNGNATNETQRQQAGVEQFAAPIVNQPGFHCLHEGVSAMFPSGSGGGYERVAGQAVLRET